MLKAVQLAILLALLIGTGCLARKSVATQPGVAEKIQSNLFTNSIGMQFVTIPSGTFMMGGSQSYWGQVGAGAPLEKGKPPTSGGFHHTGYGYLVNNLPQHQVTISKAFQLAVTEVTQGKWLKVMGSRPKPWFETPVKDGESFPAACINWVNAVEFCQRLSKHEGVSYRLPTESEWEYACRAGTTTQFSFGDDENKLGEYAWFEKNSGAIKHNLAYEVATKKPNPWGLHDMHGGVLEWCQDRWHHSYKGAPVNGSPWMEGKLKRGVTRGGSLRHRADCLRSAYRHPWIRSNAINPHGTIPVFGFRVVRELPAK